MKKFIEIDGVKYKINPDDETKPLLDDKGEKILYVEEKPKDPVVPPKDPAPTDQSLDALAKTNPEVARMLQEKKQLEEDKRKQDEEAETERKAQLEKNGEFQILAQEAETKRVASEAKQTEQTEIIKKQNDAFKGLRDDMLAQIPEDKRSLIPEVSARKQIDYIRANAKHLGVSILNKGGKVPDNGNNSPLDEEGELTKRYNEYLKRSEDQPNSMTIRDKDDMLEIGRKLKEIRANK